MILKSMVKCLSTGQLSFVFFKKIKPDGFRAGHILLFDGLR